MISKEKVLEKEEISKIWSGNLLRVLTEVTEIAKNIQTSN